jgi:hypothetical protein
MVARESGQSVRRFGDSHGAGTHTMVRVPEISRFLGVVISMYFREHGVAHFHAVYGVHQISVEVQSRTVRGTFPPRLLRHVVVWAALHEVELLANWELARQGKPLNRIMPLE